MEAPLSPRSKNLRRPPGPKPNPYSSSSSTSSSSLHLSSLPRFHPANYNSASSSMVNTPSGSAPGILSPNPSSNISQINSPRRFFDPEQRHLSYYHQHLLAQSTCISPSSSGGGGKKPVSPKLAPLQGSPGPVTPLELDGDEYLSAGARGSGTKSPLGVEAFIAQEERRARNELSPRRGQ